MIHPSLSLPLDSIRDLCRRFGVRELAVFGSARRLDFREDSDVDFLVEFQPEVRIGLVEYAGLQNQLEDLLGRKVDLVTKHGLKQPIAREVLGSREIIYAA